MILQVIPSRIAMAIPGMTIPPLIMAKLERTTTYIKNPWLRAPTTVITNIVVPSILWAVSRDSFDFKL